MSNKNQRANTQNTGACDVKIYAVHLDGDVLADASVTYNGCFAIRGLKLMKDDNGGVYAAMPGYQSARGFVEVCTPNDPDVYEQLKDALLDAYRQKLTQMREQSLGTAQKEQEIPAREQTPTAVAVRVNTLRDGPALADVSIDVGGAFTVNGARIVSSENGLFVSMPRLKTASGYTDACFPCTSEFHEQVRNAALDAYQQTLAQVCDQTAAPKQRQEPAQGMSMVQTM